MRKKRQRTTSPLFAQHPPRSPKLLVSLATAAKCPHLSVSTIRMPMLSQDTVLLRILAIMLFGNASALQAQENLESRTPRRVHRITHDEYVSLTTDRPLTPCGLTATCWSPATATAGDHGQPTVSPKFKSTSHQRSPPNATCT